MKYSEEKFGLIEEMNGRQMKKFIAILVLSLGLMFNVSAKETLIDIKKEDFTALRLEIIFKQTVATKNSDIGASDFFSILNTL